MLSVKESKPRSKPKVEGLKEAWRCQNVRCGRTLSQYPTLPMAGLTKCPSCGAWNVIEDGVPRLCE